MEHKFGQMLVKSMKLANDRFSHFEVDVCVVNKALFVKLDALVRAKQINMEETEIGKELTNHFIQKWAADPQVQQALPQLDFLEGVEIWNAGRLARMFNTPPPPKVRSKKGIRKQSRKKSWFGFLCH